MPTYEYLCSKCQESYEVLASISEYTKGLKPVCPRCGSRHAIRTFSRVNVLASRGPAGGFSGGCGPGAGPGCCG